MKKLGILVAAFALSVSVYASSLAIPWFVDTAPAANGVPGKAAGVTGIIVLKSNRTDTITASIDYFASDGTEMGPFGAAATFQISPLSSVSFRPVADDPSSVAGGQESPAGQAVPNRPLGASGPAAKKNGSATVSWNGGNADIQGLVTYFQTASDPSTGATVTFSYGSLLPPGF